MKQRVHVITMGCAKNLVDSEKLMAQLRLSDVELTQTIEDADVAVINTCGFIEAAKEESIDMIIANVRRKSKGRLKKVYAMGCLTERYREELIQEIPEVDGFFGSNQMKDVLTELGVDYKHELIGERLLTTPPHYAYLKISEGCDNPCSFCAIPIMRGKHVSRTMEEIVDEARLLASRRVKELVVIGQDTTYYGLDTHNERKLPELLERLADLDGVEWVRLMYAYPAKFPVNLLDVMARHPNICKYIDMPIQHISDEMLKSMRRGISRRATLELLSSIRERIPEIALRTTFIVGYPGETPRHVDELLECIRSIRFDRLGVFTYSVEDGTTAYPLGDTVAQEEKERRRSLIMEAQQEISTENNDAMVGRKCRVLIDRHEEGQFVGRTYRDAPEIDNEVHVHGEGLDIGTFCDVEIVEASEYDVVGRLLR